MKQRFIIAMLVATLILPPLSSVFGQEEGRVKPSRTMVGATSSRETKMMSLESKRAEMDAQKEAKRAELEAKRAANKTKREEFKQEIATRKVEQVMKVSSATVVRLEQIITRIESRIVKVNQKGGNTTEAVASVALAKGKLAEARTAIDAMGAIDLTGTDAQANFEQIRTSAAAVRELIRAAHKDLMLAVRSLSAVEAPVDGSSVAQ
jgi:hypothetical protein